MPSTTMATDHVDFLSSSPSQVFPFFFQRTSLSSTMMISSDAGGGGLAAAFL